MGAIAVPPLRVAEGAAHDEIAQQRPVPRIRHRDVQERAGRSDVMELRQHRAWVDEMLEHVVGEDRVEGLRDGAEHVFDAALEDGVVDATRLLRRLRVQLDALEVRRSAPDRAADTARAAADVEHPSEWIGK